MYHRASAHEYTSAIVTTLILTVVSVFIIFKIIGLSQDAQKLYVGWRLMMPDPAVTADDDGDDTPLPQTRIYYATPRGDLRQLLEEAARRFREAFHGASAHRPYHIFRDEHGTVWVLSRGVQTAREVELAGNATQQDFHDGGQTFRVHTGALTLFHELQSTVLREVAAHRNATDRVVFVGHSMGAALSLLYAIALERTMPGAVSAAVLFGAPRVVSKSFASHIERSHLGPLVHRVINEADAVCHLPLQVMPQVDSKQVLHYSHVGKPTLIFESLDTDLPGSHLMRVYHRACQQIIGG